MFVPFVLDTFGGSGGEARNFYNILSNAIAGYTGAWSHYHVVAGLRDAVAAVVQADTENIIQAAWSQTASRLDRSKN